MEAQERSAPAAAYKATIMCSMGWCMNLQAALMEVREAWQGTAQQLQQREATQVQQVGQAVQQLREDLQRQLPSGKLKAIESKLAALEGSVLSAGLGHLCTSDAHASCRLSELL